MVFLTSLLLNFAIALADAPTTLWKCEVSAQLRGNGSHYLIYGRDSFSGRGRLQCITEAQAELSLEVDLMFTSAGLSHGANETTIIPIEVHVATTQPPLTLHARAFVQSQEQSGGLAYAFASELTAVAMFATVDEDSSLRASLEQGTLSIRARASHSQEFR